MGYGVCQSVILGKRIQMAYPVTLLVDGAVLEGLSLAVLTVPQRLRLAVLEANHVVLPIPDMISHDKAEVHPSEIKSVEVHVKGIDQTGSEVVDNDGATDGVASLAISVRCLPKEPCRVVLDVVFGRQVDILAALIVQIVQVVQGQRIRGVTNHGEIDLGSGVVQLAADV